MIETILIISIIALVGVGSCVAYNFLERWQIDEKLEKSHRDSIENGCNKYYIEMARNDERKARADFDNTMHELFGNYTRIDITNDPLKNDKCVVCSYKNGDTIKWELKGKKLPTQPTISPYITKVYFDGENKQ